MFRPLCALFACTALVACDRGRPDVLQEFPPPRLARENVATAFEAASAPADCKLTWRLLGRTSRETYHLVGRGTFEVGGQSAPLISGVVAIDPATSQPELRPSVERALQSRGAGTPWLWRLQGVERRSLGLEAPLQSERRQLLGGSSEIELNGVRTRQTHDVTLTLTSSEDDLDDLQIETQLRVDLAAHHVRPIVLADDAPPRRADLRVKCSLVSHADGE